MRGIRIGIRFDIQDRFQSPLKALRERLGGIRELQKQMKLQSMEYFQSFKAGFRGLLPNLDAFKLKNIALFDAIETQFPMLGRFTELMTNPYVLGTAAVAGFGVALFSLGNYLNDSTRELKKNQTLVQNILGTTGQATADSTAQIMALNKVFGTDVKQISQAANTMTKEFESMGVKVGDSINGLQTALVATNGLIDIDQFKEYSVQMKEAGLSMDQFTALAIMQQKEGVFGDKGLDAIKEFKLRLKEMTPAGNEALKGIGLSGKEMLKQLDNGTMTSFDGLRKVVATMKGASTQARQTIMANLFGGAGEDAGFRFLEKLGGTELSLEKIKESFTGAQLQQLKMLELHGKIIDQQNRYAEILKPIIDRWDIIKLKVHLFFNETLANGIEFLKTGFNTITENIKYFRWGIEGLGVAFVLLKANMVQTFAIASFNAVMATIKMAGLSLATFSWAGALNAVKVAFFSIPIVGWIAAVIAGAIILYKEWGFFRHSVDGLLNVFMEFMPVLREIGNFAASVFTALITKNFDAIGDAWDGLKSTFSNFDLFDSFDKGFEKSADKTKELREKLKLNTPAPDPDPTGWVLDTTTSFTPTAPIPTTPTNNVGIGSGSGQTRNITVNIDKLNEGGINLVTQNIQDSAANIEDALMEILLNAVRKTEQSLG